VLLAALLVFVGFALALWAFALFARRVRRSGMGGGIMGPMDEVWHPAAHRFRQEIQIQEERMVPLPPADGLPLE
jgi:hypothetical protein